MKPRTGYGLFASMIIAGITAVPAHGSLMLSSLVNPTLQTLINLGSTGVDVGTDEFSSFSFVDLSVGIAHSASQIQIQPLTTTGSGLQFISGWSTGDGSTLDNVIAYDVKSTSAAQPISQIALLSNGTAPVPAAGTYTAATLISQLPGGSPAAAVLSTYNDGITTPVDITKPDVNYALVALTPQNQLHVTDTLIVSSASTGTGGGDGVAAVSFLQNGFVNVPEPTEFLPIVLPIVGWITLSGRRRRAVLR